MFNEARSHSPGCSQSELHLTLYLMDRAAFHLSKPTPMLSPIMSSVYLSVWLTGLINEYTHSLHPCLLPPLPSKELKTRVFKIHACK